MCRPDDFPPFTQPELVAMLSIVDPCPGCGVDRDDPHEQHAYDCAVEAERQGSRGFDA
jgi:hypothetical protein